MNKNYREIFDQMKIAGGLAAETLDEITKYIEPGISTNQLDKIFKKKKIENYELIKGDVLKTIPKYIKKNPKLKISLLNIDIDFVETTQCVLDNFYDKVVKGGIVLFDNYQGVGTGGTFYKGETETINKFLKKINKRIIKFSFFNRPSYIIK